MFNDDFMLPDLHVKSILNDWGYNMEIISILFGGKKVGSKVYLFVFYEKFLPDFVPVSIDCTCGQIHEFCDFFCGFTLLDKICYLNFRGSEL